MSKIIGVDKDIGLDDLVNIDGKDYFVGDYCPKIQPRITLKAIRFAEYVLSREETTAEQMYDHLLDLGFVSSRSSISTLGSMLHKLGVIKKVDRKLYPPLAEVTIDIEKKSTRVRKILSDEIYEILSKMQPLTNNQIKTELYRKFEIEASISKIIIELKAMVNNGVLSVRKKRHNLYFINK